MSGSPSPARSLANEPGERAWAGEADTLPAVDFDGFQAEAFGEDLPQRLTHLWRPAAEQGLGPGDAATIFFIRALVGDVTFVTDCSVSSSATSAFLRYSSAFTWATRTSSCSPAVMASTSRPSFDSMRDSSRSMCIRRSA